MSDTVFVLDRQAVDHATGLRARFGESAALEATMRATRSRHVGDGVDVCRWRQVERIVAMRDDAGAPGRVH